MKVSVAITPGETGRAIARKINTVVTAGIEVGALVVVEKNSGLEKIYSIKELAALTPISERQWRKVAQDKEITTIMFGKIIGVAESVVLRYLKENSRRAYRDSYRKLVEKRLGRKI